VLGLFILGSLRRRVASTAALVGFAAGACAVLGVWLPSTWGPALLGWPWYAPVGMISTVAVALVFDLLVLAHGPSVNGRPQPGVDEPR
jgi:hypothetical protein